MVLDPKIVSNSLSVMGDNPWWLPIPQQWKIHYEVQLTLASFDYVRLSVADHELQVAAQRFMARLDQYLGIRWTVVVRGPHSGVGVDVTLEPMPHPEGYRLETAEGRIRIIGDRPGVFHAFTTLWQLVTQYGPTLPGLEVEDWPRFSIRGVMLDISRTKIPTMETLCQWVDRLADLKMNHLELYMENAFAYRGQEASSAHPSALTGAEVVALDRFCRERYIDLVPNQNSFGHLTKWLVLPRYQDLAECPGGTDFPDGHFNYPWALNPTDPQSMEFLEGLYDELLPHFSSGYFNVGCDETFDLGKGKSQTMVESLGRGTVYLNFLRQVVGLAGDHAKTALYWADMISRHHPERIAELPDEGVALEWGYDQDYPFDRQVKALADAGKRFITCPSTGTWLSLLGRSHQMMENTRKAAIAADRHGGLGLVTTEWGDWGHFQPLVVAEMGVAASAAMAWNPLRGVGDAFLPAVSLCVFGDASGRIGQALWNLGSIHAEAGGTFDAEADYFAPLVEVLFRPWRWDTIVPRLSIERVNAAEEMMSRNLIRVSEISLTRPDADQVGRELRFMGELLALAMEIVRRLQTGSKEPWKDLQQRLTAILSIHHHLWLERNRPGGLAESLAYLEPLKERLLEGPSCQFASLDEDGSGLRLFRYPL